MVQQEVNKLEMASLNIVYNNLSPLDEKKGRRGICHLIEHMIGVTFDPIIPELHEYAICDDMFTSHEHVVASFSGTAEAMEMYAHKIINTLIAASSKNITREQFEMERDAVYNEIAELGSDFNAVMLNKGLEKVYGIHAPEGYLEEVKAYTFEQFKKDYDKYVPHPSDICYVGPRTLDLPDLAQYKSGKYRIAKYPKMKLDIQTKPKRSDIAIEKDAEYVGVSAFGTKPVTTNKEFAALNIACRILGGESDSAFFDELRTKNHLVYSCGVSVEPFRMMALPVFFTSATADKVPQVIALVKKVLNNPEEYITEEKFNRTQRMLCMVLKQQKIMRFSAAGNLTRYGMINDSDETPFITYKYMLQVVRKHLGKDSYRIFAES